MLLASMTAAKDRRLSTFVFCVVICFFTIVAGTLDGNQITYPERIDGKRPRRDLSTSGKYGAHSFFQTKEQDSSDVYKGCGNEDVYTDSHVSEDTSRDFGHFSTIRRGMSNMDDFYRPYLTTNETRYNELLMVADYRMYLDYNNDTATIKDRVITLVNAVDAVSCHFNSDPNSLE
ncbi:hypothetical protein P5673_019241 [Acropora cervicornis]|uniref:Uncharacterized protein n=1 Tax=Acropora cervicornis TaxID=6130 RepID=A0AAD9QC50_ACRCE|nr:hypothetical protein P5673_019241 [Acropora cervicornis]